MTTLRWFSSAQLALAFAEMGWEVHGVCPEGHPMTRTRAVRACFPFRVTMPLRTFAAAILRVRPELVVPSDDLAAAWLHRLHARATRRAERDGMGARRASVLMETLERSLGDPAGYWTIESRAAFADQAAGVRVAMPRMASPESEEELLEVARQWGYPIVLKTDGTWGGEGVRVVGGPSEVKACFRELRRPLSTASVLLRLFLDGNRNVVLPWLLRRRRRVSVQSFAPGADANIAVACRRGEVLASIAVEAVSTERRHGPSAVVQVVDSPAMLEAATRMVRAMGLSGLCGFDFVLDPETGSPVLLEINGRATPTCHLALGPGRDLVASLCAAASGQPPRSRPPVTTAATIALFPLGCALEAESRPAGAGRVGVYRDLPRGEPALVSLAVARSRRLTRARCRSFLSLLIRWSPWRAREIGL